MATPSSGVLAEPAYPTVPKVQPEECESPSESFGRCERPTNDTLPADVQLPAYSNQLIPSDSYNFLTGEEGELLEVPIKETSQSQGASDADVGSAQSSALIGTLFSNPGHSPGSYLYQSSSAPKSGSWESFSAAAQYSNPVQNILISGSELLAAPTSTVTAQLLVGGLQGGSFDVSRNTEPSEAVYYPSSNNSQETMQLYYVNPGFPHGFSSDKSGVTVIYPPPDGRTIGSSSQQSSRAHDQQQYSLPFLHSNLAHSGLNQQALEVISSPAGVPLSHQSLAASRQSYSNWRNGGNEHAFLPINEASQNTSSQFGTDFPPYGVGRGALDLSHMQQNDQLQGEVGHNHMDHLYGGSVNGQGLSLSLSSHQPQSSALHFQGQIPEPNMDAAAAFSQAAAIVKTKEEASRYDSSSSHDAGLNHFRTSTREEVLGARFQHDHVNVGARKHVESAASNSHFSETGFLRSAQDILNEVCRVTPLKRPPKPAARSSDQQWNMAAGSSASIDGNLTYYGSEGRTAVHTEVDSARDPASFADTTLLMTSASHVSHSNEISQSFADTVRTENRDDLDLKKGKLRMMLDEVQGRYRRYCDHLHLVISGCNSQAGPNTATPYTILALQAMSRHFRCLRDAIGSQLRVVKRALGEDDGIRTGKGETSRHRYADQQIRQQRALQQLGMLQQHAWRPQRGLPERSVSVLRAWLFEHFLHPYPKDVDKMTLAKQTGLTRSQVSNWFINARVRLWKPMVEEMYLEEQREAEEASRSERLAREQGDIMGINNFGQYGDRGLQINSQSGIGQLTSIAQKCMDSKDREDAVGLNAEGQTGTCSKQTREVLHCTLSSSNGVAHTEMLAEEQQQQQVAAGRAVDTYNSQESREAKRARNYGSNSSNVHPSIISDPVFNMSNRSENCANSQGYSTDSENMCKTDNAFSPGHGLHRDAEDMYCMSQKGAPSIGQLEPNVAAGSSGTYEGNNPHRYDHDAHTLAYVPRTSGGVNSATNTAVSLTLGLRHCESNLRSAMVATSVLSKYRKDLHEPTDNQLKSKVANQLEGDVDDSSNNGGHHSSAGFSNGHYIPHPLHNHSDDSNHPLSPGRGKRVASQALMQHEFVAN